MDLLVFESDVVLISISGFVTGDKLPDEFNDGLLPIATS